VDIHLLISIANPERRKLTEAVFTRHPPTLILGIGATLTDTYLSAVQVTSANLIAIDLTQAQADKPNFWITLHVIYPAVTLLIFVEPSISRSALQAALHAGAHCFVQWTDPPHIWYEAAQAALDGKRYYSALWLITMASQLIRDLEIGQDAIGAARDEPTLFGPDLSRLDYALLTYFIVNLERVLTINELLLAVWKSDRLHGGTDHQVRSSIKRLRKKLIKDSSRYEIETVHGHGYRIIEIKAEKSYGHKT
jgi:DNA-binding NarL/FixJ family response regulator